MKSIRQLSMVPALALLVSTPALAQDTSDATAMAKEPKAPAFVFATLGEDAIVKNAGDERLGTVRDHIIERTSGQVLFVVVHANGTDAKETRLVPYAKFAYDADAKGLILPFSSEELGAMPLFDTESFEKDVRAIDASAKKITPRLSSTMLLGSKVMAADQKLGKLGKLVLEARSGQVAFVLAKDEAPDPRILPWKSLSWKPSGETEGPLGHFDLELDAARIDGAPRLPKGELGKLEEREVRQGIFRYFGQSEPVRIGS